jgi:hypothetical protein
MSKILMIYQLLADLVLFCHLAFVLFAGLGGLLVLRHPRVLWLHLPVLAWGVFVEWANWICPLTPLENDLRRLGGETGYTGGFVEHLLVPVLYPETLTLELRYALGMLLIGINAAVYGYVVFEKRRECSNPHVSKRES